MRYDRPIVLSIAGLDPCGGAGVLADIKTFEQHKCLGMAVNSAITNQVEDRFISIDWVPADKIISQLQLLTGKYNIDFVKIGIIENMNTLYQVVNFLKLKNEKIKIVWDTVLAASSGFTFLERVDTKLLQDILKQVFLITPNTTEAVKLSQNDTSINAAKDLAQYCNVLLKGGHSDTERGVDHLFYDNKQLKIATKNNFELPAKHGSGCILSASILSQLALGEDIETACVKSKTYIENILNSNSNLLAYHV
jgi:hydroxymethylpyrimidine/phosphomethylpyrimidine kinase